MNLFSKLRLILVSSLLFFTIFTGLFVYSFGGNVTKKIFINISQSESTDTIKLDYYILQTFNADKSRGVFLSLPKNQDGVWTEYNIKNVKRSDLVDPSKIGSDWSKIVNQISMQPEKHEQIKEWNEFRLRIGSKDKFLEKGSYLYHLQLEAKTDPKRHSFVVLRDWSDPVNSLAVNINDQVYCPDNDKQVFCNSAKTQVLFNTSQGGVSTFQKRFLDWWIYLVTIIIVLILTICFWWIFAKDPDYGYETGKPEFEPPGLYPWQADFLVTEGAVDFKATFLSYLLWLSYKKIIRISPQKDQEIWHEDEYIGIDKINIQLLQPLPDILPSEYNDCLDQISKLGFSKGIYESKFNGSVSGKTYSYIQKTLQQYYHQKGSTADALISIGALSFLFGTPLVYLVILTGMQTLFLLGNSYFPVITFAYLLSVVGLLFVMSKKSKLTREGAFHKAYCERYKFYIQKAEQYKLDFSNNPEQGVQYYLAALPFAVSFGFLLQFRAYLQKSFGQNSEVDTTDLLSNSFNQVIFYTPPSYSDNSSNSNDFSSSSSSGGFSDGGGSW